MLNRPKRYLSRECLNDERISWEYMLDFYKDKRYVCDRIERLQYDLKMMSRMGPFAAINYIRHVIGYEEYLKEYAGFRRMNVEDLLEVLSDLQESAREYHTYEEWFIYIEKYTEEMEQLKKRQQEVKDGVHLTTMHSSKGLEYEKVFILDAAEGITPYKKAVLEPDLEEERRRKKQRAVAVGAASNEMCDFLILNISSLQLIPVNIIAFRTEYGSVTPTAIVGPAILATAISTGAAVLYIKTKNWMARPEKANNIFTKMVLKNEKASHIMGESK